MTITPRTFFSAVACALLSLNACAQTPANHQGPYLPPELRTPAPSKPASGQALHNEAMAKLKQRFDQADLDADRSITREEAKRAGLGFIDANFDDIDVSGRGKVSFDDVRKFLAQRGK
ncbi:EF-hand domain-containing protein [Massilia sp. CF038]|uniref:EF-hand domain-containing protein n=1 Tax=Massilia sp. CF038 TaxID=1881045 RepID=UPI000910C5E4|nr:EF-hand domain-containing protein [Massilia sp. CF038]SHG66470.1 hypothetical protein SAMN05428948_1512 [Massilia sp. CF038]